MDPLDLDIVEGVQGNVDVHVVLDPLLQPLLAIELHFLPALLELDVSGLVGNLADGVEVAGPLDVLSQLFLVEFGKPGVAAFHPPSWSDSVRFVLEFLRIHLVEVLEQSVLDQLRMDRSHPIHRMRPNHAQIRHPYLLAIALLHTRQRTQFVHVVRVLVPHHLQEKMVHFVDQLQVPREQPLDQRNVPLFERFREHGVVGVGEHLVDDVEGTLVLQSLLVNHHSQQLHNGQRGMRVVQLDGHHGRQLLPRPLSLPKSPQHILDRRTHEKILLLQPQFLPLVAAIVRIQHTRYILRPLSLLNRMEIVPFVEQLKIELVGRNRLPQTEINAVESVVARERVVVGFGLHDLPVFPNRPIPLLSHIPIEPDRIVHIPPLYLPRIHRHQPIVRHFYLIPILDFLLEDPVIISDSIPPSRIIQCC